MSEEVEVSRGEDPTGPVDQVKDWVKSQLEQSADRAQIELVETGGLTPPGSEWEIWAFGPFQAPGTKGSVIEVGEQASVVIAVWMNGAMLPIIEGYESHIGLDIYTSNIATMLPVPALSGFTHIETAPGGAHIPLGPLGGIYLCEWRLTPQEAACLYEANICVKIANCKGHCLPDYAGFARQVFDFDLGRLFPGGPEVAPGRQFNNPVRFMAYPEDCSIPTDEDSECPLVTP